MSQSKQDSALIQALTSFYKADIVDKANGVSYSWADFFYQIRICMENRQKNQYPYVQLNPNNSLSFLMTPAGEDSKSSQKLLHFFHNKTLIRVLTHLCQESELPLIGDSGQLFEERSILDYIEVICNLSPEHLDSLLRLNDYYTGYHSNETNLLNLSKQFTAVPGYLRLFPLLSLGNQTNLIRAAGCQIPAMTAVQFLRLMPGYSENHTTSNFHWIPESIQEYNYLIYKAIGTLLEQENILLFRAAEPQANCIAFAAENAYHHLYKDPEPLQDRVRLLPMDEAAKTFYRIYGNETAAGLEQCQSLEVKTSLFLQLMIRSDLERYDRLVDNPSNILACHKRLATLETMIRTEEIREGLISSELKDSQWSLSPDEIALLNSKTSNQELTDLIDRLQQKVKAFLAKKPITNSVLLSNLGIHATAQPTNLQSVSMIPNHDYLG